MLPEEPVIRPSQDQWETMRVAHQALTTERDKLAEDYLCSQHKESSRRRAGCQACIVAAQAALVAQLREALIWAQISCPCGARSNSAGEVDTINYPHVSGCRVAAALASEGA